MKIPAGINASFPPSREGPPPATVPVHTGGLYPRDYRQRLLDDDGPFSGVSEFDSTTVHYRGDSPIIGTAMHYHHAIRADIKDKMVLSDEARFYEEDPETHRFLGRVMHCLTPNQSRYELDLNRPPDTTLYTEPKLAWGQQVWGEPLNQFEREFSLEKWYEFHTMMDCAVEDAITHHGYAVVLDFHSYNHQRKGPTNWRTDDKPVINLGTRHLDLDDFGRKLKDDFCADIQQHTVLGEEAMIQENGVFYGGYLNRRLSHLFGKRAITLSVEYKKVYMDEASGVVDETILQDLVNQMDESIVAMAERLGVDTMAKQSVPVETPYTARPTQAS